MIGPGVHKHYERPQLTTGVPVLVTKDSDHIIISSGKIVVPASVVVDINFSRDGVTFPGHPSDVVGATNQIIDLDGVEAQQIKLTKTGGAGTAVEVTYAQGDRGGTTQITNIPHVVVDSGSIAISNTPNLVTYNSTPLVKANGETGTLQGDSALRAFMREAFAAKYENNPLSVAQVMLLPTAAPDGSWNLFKNLGANNTLNMKASGGNIQSVYCRSRSAAIAYLQLFITATVPVNGNVPDFTFMIPIGGSIMYGSDFFGLGGVWGALGWAFAFSSTENTLTLGTAADHTTLVTIK